jgi:hypothetical protein
MYAGLPAGQIPNQTFVSRPVSAYLLGGKSDATPANSSPQTSYQAQHGYLFLSTVFMEGRVSKIHAFLHTPAKHFARQRLVDRAA